jgi:hypothetical protein
MTVSDLLSPADAAELARLRTRSAAGLTLTDQQRRLLSTRLMLQLPTDLTGRQVKAIADDLDKRIKGLPPGAFMALDALRLLADGGNKVADYLFDLQSEKLGLTRPFSSYRR